MKTVGIIRNRGQLTIPDSVRKIARWASPMSAVSITIVNPGEIVIKPQSGDTDWDDIWADVKKARAIKGEGETVSAAAFLQTDRAAH